MGEETVNDQTDSDQSNAAQTDSGANGDKPVTANSSNPQDAAPLRPLRVWPAVILVVGLFVTLFSTQFAAEATFPLMMTRFLGPLACSLLLVLWWLFFSRASWPEKLWGLAALAAIGVVANFLADKSVTGVGMLLNAIPWGIASFAVVAAVFGWLLSSTRTWLAVIAAVGGFGYWDLVRTDEIRGDFRDTVHNWRWEPSAEELFLESLAKQQKVQAPAVRATPGALPKAEWPSFRGPRRDGVQPNVVLAEDWKTDPPKEKWRTVVGPGWSSFAVAGDRIFTQEQRGNDEATRCLDAGSGAEVWAFEYESRFWEVVAGAGPRGTPTIVGPDVFALGANGILHCLDRVTG